MLHVSRLQGLAPRRHGNVSSMCYTHNRSGVLKIRGTFLGVLIIRSCLGKLPNQATSISNEILFFFLPISSAIQAAQAPMANSASISCQRPALQQATLQAVTIPLFQLAGARPRNPENQRGSTSSTLFYVRQHETHSATQLPSGLRMFEQALVAPNNFHHRVPHC